MKKAIVTLTIGEKYENLFNNFCKKNWEKYCQKFNYDLISGKEFEVLNYTSGRNWIDERGDRNVVSHLGMHCTNAELIKWKEFFKERFIEVAQEVFTDSHTNPAIAGKRSYNYVIFDTQHILGVDLKFIVRINKDDSV